MKRIVRNIPGLALVAGIAIVAYYANRLYKPLSAVAIAMVLGLLIRNVVGEITACRSGVAFAVKRLLRIAIVLLGVRLSFVEVVRTCGDSLVIILSCVVFALVLVHLLGKALGLPGRLATLIGVGTCICGNSAIMATAPVIDAEDGEISFAVATITLFGVLAVLVYPVIGHILHMSDISFGLWAGTAINDTSQVVTAAFIYSDEAGKVATVVKLTRNLLMAPVILLMGIAYARNSGGDGAKRVDMKKAFPLFVVGFVVMAVLRTLGVFPKPAITFLKQAANILIICAIAGVGLNTSFAAMKKTGLKPFYVGLAASCMLGVLSFFLVRLLSARV